MHEIFKISIFASVKFHKVIRLNEKIHYQIMNKTRILLIVLLIVSVSDCFAQLAPDGSYLWNIQNVSYPINQNTHLLLNAKEQYSNQIDRHDFFHIELDVFRNINQRFSVGLGYRQTENYKSDVWFAGHNYLLYGICFFSPANLKIKFANRVVYKSFRNADSQIGLDNITNVDFFVRSTNHIPKPYISDEVFSELKSMEIQNVRLYGGLHVWNREHLAFDIFYCDLFVNSANAWKNFNVFGLNTKFTI